MRIEHSLERPQNADRSSPGRGIVALDKTLVRASPSRCIVIFAQHLLLLTLNIRGAGIEETCEGLSSKDAALLIGARNFSFDPFISLTIVSGIRRSSTTLDETCIEA